MVLDDMHELDGTDSLLSSRKLTPLVIPSTNAPIPRLQSKHSSSQLRSGSTPPADSQRYGRFETSTPSLGRLTPASTPDLYNSRSNVTTPETFSSSLPTPISAPHIDYRVSPHPWEGPMTTHDEGTRSASAMGHRRGASESSTMSIMDRGRPRKRPEACKPIKTTEAQQTKSSERRAFEELPWGFKPAEAIGKLNANDVTALHKQALGQAERFEVLRVEDVEALSKVRQVPISSQLNFVYILTGYKRNSASLMTEQSTYAAHTLPSAPVAAIYTHASANTCAPPASPSLATTPCSSRKRPSPSWTRPLTTG